MHLCNICNKEIPKRKHDSVKKYLTRVVCSRVCYKEYCNLPEKKEFYSKNGKKSTGCLGKIWTDEERQKHSIALTGRKFSEEACKNISLGHKGEKAYQWKGGITPLNRLIRVSAEYKKWRLSVLHRDDFTCQHCSKRGGKLQVDHIKPFALYPELRINLDNGRTLCVNCHKKTDTWGFKTVNLIKTP